MLKDSEALVDRYLAISRAIAGQLDYQNVLRKVAEEVDSLFQPDHMDVALILPDRRDCAVVFEVGIPTGWSQVAEPSPIVNLPNRTLLWGQVKSLLTGDAWEDERFHFDGSFSSPIFDAKLHSRLHVPMQVHGVVHGALNISSHQKNKYTEADVETAQQVADLLAPYIYALIRTDQARKAAMAEGAARGRAEALRLGALRLTEGMEKARKRLGMDLHDQTLADLTRISHRVARMGRQKAYRTPELVELGDEVATCIKELRRIIEDTRPGVLELFGFGQAVEAQLERSVAGRRPAIDFEVRDNGSDLLDSCPESQRTTLFRIVQEAINNAVKHGHPKSVAVAIDVDEDHLLIEVADDGCGVTTQPQQPAGGLDNMRVRAALISATIEIIGNHPKGGTRVVVRVPLTELHRPPNAVDDILGQGRTAKNDIDAEALETLHYEWHVK